MKPFQIPVWFGLALFLCGIINGCIGIVIYSPAATHAGIQNHEQIQNGSSNTLNNAASVPVTQKLLDKVSDQINAKAGIDITGNKGVEVSGNSASAQNEVKLK